MRSCRRFLAGIPHQRVGHPCVTHPSATPSGTEAPEDVRLACVRHAASVYPEPGSNSPSMFYVTTADQRPSGGTAPCVRAIQAIRTSRRCTGLFADCVLPLCAPPPARCVQSRGGRALILTGTAVFALVRVHPVAVLLSTLQLSRCPRSKSCLLLHCLLETSITRQELNRALQNEDPGFNFY